MLELDVFVGLDKAQPIRVQPDIAAAHSGDEVLWHIHCLDDAVSHVEIDFEDSADEFFLSRSATPPSKKCHTRLRGKRPGQYGSLMGVAPELRGPGARKNKYWIRAYAGDPGAGGKLAYEVDPLIVTVDP